jgi:hypothetical protein
MAQKPGRDKVKAPPARRSQGFLRAGGLIHGQMKAVSTRRGFALARLAAIWPEIAGVSIAAICRPAKLAAARGPAGGVLTLAVAPAHGPELQMQLPLLRDRVNAALGPGAVGRIQLVQAAAPFADPPVRVRPRPALPADLGALAGPVSSIGDDDLRHALETLARNVLSRSATIQKPKVQP